MFRPPSLRPRSPRSSRGADHGDRAASGDPISAVPPALRARCGAGSGPRDGIEYLRLALAVGAVVRRKRLHVAPDHLVAVDLVARSPVSEAAADPRERDGSPVVLVRSRAELLVVLALPRVGERAVREGERVLAAVAGGVLGSESLFHQVLRGDVGLVDARGQL